MKNAEGKFSIILRVTVGKDFYCCDKPKVKHFRKFEHYFENLSSLLVRPMNHRRSVVNVSGQQLH